MCIPAYRCKLLLLLASPWSGIHTQIGQFYGPNIVHQKNGQETRVTSLKTNANRVFAQFKRILWRLRGFQEMGYFGMVACLVGFSPLSWMIFLRI